jgi:thiamine pyrophosphate-dependent acetolactate synthase large subunit-like protein
MPRVLKIAIRQAIGKRGVSVIVIPGDVALQPAVNANPQSSDLLFSRPALVPSENDINRLADLLNVSSRVTLLCGSGCAGAQDKVLQLAEINNGALSFVELEQRAAGFLNVGTGLKNPNFAAMAEAIGIRGIRAERPGEVETAISDALSHDGPVLVDAVVNRTELAMPPAITASMAKGFTLYMLKAILSGQGSEIVELAETNLLR